MYIEFSENIQNLVSVEIQGKSVIMEAYAWLEFCESLSNAIKKELIRLDEIEPKCTGGADPINKDRRNSCYCGHERDCDISVWERRKKVTFKQVGV